MVLDTSVLVSAFRSRRGPAARLIATLGTGLFEVCVSVPLVLEYEEVLCRGTDLARKDVLDVLRYVCSIAHRQKIYFLWRPLLCDPDDEMVLELAIASRARYIVTYNRRDFVEADRFQIQVVTPRKFLGILGVEG